MSCNCSKEQIENQFSCECDAFDHPLPLSIGAGLHELPRQIAGFPEFRRAMLYAIFNKDPLQFFKARQPGDLAVMLLEMWAYVCDSLSFYDKVIIQESYLRTAHLRPSLRKLVALLGYVPRPAVGASAFLMAMAEGRQRIRIPQGTAFRSGAFADNPPQVFETENPAFIHPLVNRWNIRTPLDFNRLPLHVDSILVEARREILPVKPYLIRSLVQDRYDQPIWVVTSQHFTSRDRILYRRITFTDTIILPPGYLHLQLQLVVPIHTAGLWTISVGETPASLTEVNQFAEIVLNTLRKDIKKGDDILISNGTDVRNFRVVQVTEVTRLQNAGDTVVINENSFQLPGISVPVTQLRLNKGINEGKRADQTTWINDHRAELIVHFGFENAGAVVAEARKTLATGDLIILEGNVEKPFDDHLPGRFQFRDKNLQAVKINGRLDFDLGEIIPDQGENWYPDLNLPVEAFGNVLEISRGETVLNEILGSGDASAFNQVFKLKKNPLTYLPSRSVDNAQGITNTLKIYVDGIRWRETASFFNRKPDEQIYIVRQNDEGDSLIIFGDGIHGQRLPSGHDNVTANYRFGAGAAAPPAGSINQISTPIPGLISVENLLAAGGGADREHTEGIRKYAPRSVLTLGRAVSIQDSEAIVAAMPGVHVVKSEWRWHGEKQAPVIQLWYIGDPGIETFVIARLRSVMDPDVMIAVDPAISVSSTIHLDIDIDARYAEDGVLRQLNQVFSTDENGFFSVEKIGIGKSLFRSQIFSAALQVAGVVSVRNILWNNEIFSEYGINPGHGHYFDFSESGIIINGNPSI